MSDNPDFSARRRIDALEGKIAELERRLSNAEGALRLWGRKGHFLGSFDDKERLADLGFGPQPHNRSDGG